MDSFTLTFLAGILPSSTFWGGTSKKHPVYSHAPIVRYHVYVDGFLKTTVRASDKTRALVEGDIFLINMFLINIFLINIFMINIFLIYVGLYLLVIFIDIFMSFYTHIFFKVSTAQSHTGLVSAVSPSTGLTKVC